MTKINFINSDVILLHLAVEEGNLNTIKFLIEKGADINVKDNQGKTPLHLAAERESPYIIKYLVKKGANINAQDENGYTALHYASNTDVMRFLIENNIDIYITDNEENTFMFYAFENGNLELIKYFVEEKAVDPLKTESGLNWTLFDRAVSSGNLDAIRYLIDEKRVVYDGNDLLIGAIVNDHFEIVKYLVEEKEVDINFASEGGWTSLLYAIEQSYIEIIDYLIAKGDDISVRDRDCSTTLHIAADDFFGIRLEVFSGKGSRR